MVDDAGVWDLKEGKLLWQDTATADQKYCLVMSHDGKTMVVGSGQGFSIKDPRTGKELRQLQDVPNHERDGNSINGIALTPNGKVLAATMHSRASHSLMGCNYGKRMQDLARLAGSRPGTRALILPGWQEPRRPLGRDLGRLRCRCRKPLLDVEGSGEPVYYVRFSPDGKQLVSADGGEVALTWDATTWRQIEHVDRCNLPIPSGISSDHRRSLPR